MLHFIAFWLIGVLLRYGYDWAFSFGFKWKDHAKQGAFAFAIGILAAYLASKANLSHWFIWILFAAAGFLTKYIVAKLGKIKG